MINKKPLVKLSYLKKKKKVVIKTFICYIYIVFFFLIDNFFSELMYLETSAKSGENVEEAFLKCCKTILAKIQNG